MITFHPLPDGLGPKPCPFCGSVPAHLVETQGSKWGAVACCCAGPEIRTGYAPPEEWAADAVEAWNERNP